MRKRDKQNALYLTAKGLSRTATNIFQKDFTFVVGGHEYTCTKFGATFISPKISELLFTDPTIDRFEIDIDDDDNKFNTIIRLMLGHSVELDGETADYLTKVSKKLENREIQGIIERMTDNMDVKSIVARIQYRIANRLKIDKEIAFAAEHFDQIPDKQIKKLDLSAFESILTDEKFQVPTEDYLFRRIMGLGDKFRNMLCYVQCQYLSDASIKPFVEAISFTDINYVLWDSLVHRLLLGVHPEKCLYRHKKSNPSFSIEKGREFKGIIDHLVKEYRGNTSKPIGPDLNEIVKITASGESYNKAYQVADFDWKDYWISNGQENAWIKYDFLDRAVHLTGYTIKSDGNGAGHLLGWAIEGSNDGEIWTVLDQRSTNELNQNNIIRWFECKAAESFRYVRLRQTAKNSSGMDSMMLSNLEFFGELEEADEE